MIRAVLFDFYDTLARRDGGRVSAGRRRLAEIAHVDAERFWPLWEKTLPGRTVGALGTLEDEIAGMLRALGTEPSAALVDELTRIERTSWIEAVTLYPNAGPTLEALRVRGFALGLVSNCSNQSGDVIRAHNLAPYFDTVALSFEVGVAKPDPRIFVGAAVRLGVSPNACAFVADGAGGELEAARALGMLSVWVKREDRRRRSDPPPVHDLCIASVAELLDSPPFAAAPVLGEDGC